VFGKLIVFCNQPLSTFDKRSRACAASTFICTCINPLIELDLIAQLRDEFDFDCASIKIACNRTHALQQRLDPVHGGPRAKLATPFKAAHRYMDAHRQDSHNGDLRRRSRRFAAKTQSSPQPLAWATRRTCDAAAQQPGRSAQSPCSSRSRMAVLLTRTPSTMKGSTCSTRNPATRRPRAGCESCLRLGAVAKIIAHHDVPHVQVAQQNFSTKHCATWRACHRRTAASPTDRLPGSESQILLPQRVSRAAPRGSITPSNWLEHQHGGRTAQFGGAFFQPHEIMCCDRDAPIVIATVSTQPLVAGRRSAGAIRGPGRFFPEIWSRGLLSWRKPKIILKFPAAKSPVSPSH